MSGKLFIVGVGPGDPGLVTVKAAQILEAVSHVFVPVSGTDRKSLACEIAKKYIPPEKSVRTLLFPMARDRNVLEKHFLESFKMIEQVLMQGKDAAFITLGDPSTYSTSWTLLRKFIEHAPDTEIEIVPGITSYAAGAARAVMTLVEGDGVLSIVSANDSLERIEAVIDASDTIIFLKTYKERQKLFGLLEKKGFLNHCIYIKRCGLDGEMILRNLKKMPEDIDYLSMIILKKQK